MEVLRAYLNTLTTAEQRDYADRSGTTVGYLRKAISTREQLREKLCIALDRESKRAVPCEALRPDVDWAYVRSTAEAIEAAPVVAAGEGV